MSVTTIPTTSGVPDTSDHVASTTPKVMVTGDIIFNTIGDVLVYAMLSECYTANDATASTIQYSVTNNTTTTSQTISAASASLANAAKGVSTLTQLGALTNAPAISNASGVGAFPWGAIRVAGNSSIKTVIGVGSTTGTWKHYVRWEPLENGAYITAAF
ncbi:MAG: hypothetical protein PHT07_20660 [Paludibacter sp.]|nr:hypothetical protein [Paludibacter sp.]